VEFNLEVKETTMRKQRLLTALAIVITLFTGIAAFAQVQTNGCGGVYCVQGRMEAGFPLDNGSAILAVLPNGSKLIFGVNYEDVTLSTGGATTDTASANILPAGALILGVNGTVTTTITGTCTGWALGDPTTAARFAASNTTLTQGTVSIGSVHATTGVASATTGLFQSADAKIRITCATGAPSTGKIRLAVTYLKFTAPSI